MYDEYVTLIRKNKLLIDGGEYTESGLVMIGGSGGEARVCEEVKYLLTNDIIEHAAFMNTCPDATAAKARMRALGIRVCTYWDIYAQMIDDSGLRNNIVRQLEHTLGIIQKLESFILGYVVKYPELEHNYVLPMITIIPQFIDNAVYIPSELHRITIAIGEYMDKLNIDSMLQVPPGKWENPEVPQPPTPATIDFDTKYNPVGTIKNIFDEWIRVRAEIGKFLVGVEKYHCNVIGWLNAVIDRCGEIVTMLIAQQARARQRSRDDNP